MNICTIHAKLFVEKHNAAQRSDFLFFLVSGMEDDHLQQSNHDNQLVKRARYT